MTLGELRKQVCKANLDLSASGLVLGTFGNVSGIDRHRGIVAIKPSGVAYSRLTPSKIVLVSLADGRAISGRLRPSSDFPTHLELYRGFGSIGGVAHTHSLHATAWAQAGQEIPPLGTTHADYFDGPVPVTRKLSQAQIRTNYELNTGRMIVRRFARRLDPARMPAVLVAGHGPFTWGDSPEQAVATAIMLEYIASIASLTLRVQPRVTPICRALLNKHFARKHGPQSYYGQKET